jgi:metal-responsive CopG/Arc/MetJ family transcriptional regulator
VYEPEQKKEFKTKRIQVLTYESLIQRVDEYAAKRGVSRAAVFEAALEAYLDKVDPKK